MADGPFLPPERARANPFGEERNAPPVPVVPNRNYSPADAFPAPAGPQPDNGAAVASLVLGVLGLFVLLSFLGIVVVNLVCSILAIVFGRIGMDRADRGERSGHRGLSHAGWICGIVGTVLGVLAIVFWVVLFVVLGSSFDATTFDTIRLG